LAFVAYALGHVGAVSIDRGKLFSQGLHLRLKFFCGQLGRMRSHGVEATLTVEEWNPSAHLRGIDRARVDRRC
jgi:hypothetical protein